MNLRIITTNCIGRDITEYKTKEEFLKELSKMIDNVECTYGSYFEVFVYSDGSVYNVTNAANIDLKEDNKSYILGLNTNDN